MNDNANRSGRPVGEFADLSGRSLLEHLLASGRTDIVEALWRYGEAQTGAEVADCVLQAGNPALAGLIAEEIMAPTIGDPVPTTIMNTLSQHRPALPKATAEALGARLLDEQPFPQSPYQSGRGVLERWVIEQEAPFADTLALAAVKEESPASSEQTVRNAAYERCRTRPKLLKDVAASMIERTETSASQATWQEVATFLQLACPVPATLSEPLKPLLHWLVERAPEYGPTPTLPDALRELVAHVALDKLREIVTGEPLRDTAGSGALLRAIEDVEGVRERTRMYASAAAHQPQLWNVLAQPIANWEDAEWKRRLSALAGGDPLQPDIAAAIIDKAPATRSVEMVDFALKQAPGGVGDPLLPRAAERLRGVLGSLASEDEATAARVEAIRWPRRSDSAETKEMLKVILDGAWSGEPELGTGLVLAANQQRQPITLGDVACLLPSQQVEQALVALEGAAERETLVGELWKVRPDELVAAASALQQRGLALDLTRALASAAPDVAFAGGGEAWETMPDDDKNELTALLVAHATETQMPLLETIVSDVRKTNAARRAQATAAIAELTPEGGALSACVVELLTSGRPELRRAGVQAIGKVKPRDEGLIRHLREIAAGGGQLGREATQVLDDLSSIFTAELSAASSLAEVRTLLPLLGAVGRPGVIEPLLGYIGPDAEYDDKDIHRLAANALRSACEFVGGDVTPEQQAALVALLEGESQEVDQQARDDVSAALASVALGEDVALARLYKEIGFDPGIAPAALYGDERDWVVRHAGLWAKEHDRGKTGRPGQLENLDIICERLTRAAYLVVGDSDNVKSQIRADETKPDYGSLIGALNSTKLSKQVANLQTLHDLRCNRTFAHIGSDPSDADMVRATESVKEAANAIIGALKEAARGR